MKHGKGFIIGSSMLFLAGAFPASGALLTGRVLNGDASPVQGAHVSIGRQGTAVSANEFGLFTLAITSVRHTDVAAKKTMDMTIRNGILSIPMSGQYAPLDVSAARTDGKVLFHLKYSNPASGNMEIKLSDYFLRAASGVYFVSIRLGESTVTLPVYYSSHDRAALRSRGAMATTISPLRKAFDAAIDTLVVTGSGYADKYVLVSSSDSIAGDIVLDTLNPPAYKQTIIATTTAADYSTGNAGTLKLEDDGVAKNCLAVGSDTYIRTYHGSVYILERYGKDNVIRINGRVISPATVEYQVNIGHSLNIQDIAFAGDRKAYITQFQSSGVVIFDPSTGTKTGTIDLSRFNTYAGTANAEQYPFMSSAITYGGYLYVACQRLAHSGVNLVPADTSCIAVVSTFNDSIVGKINLAKKNPYSMSVAAGKLYVSCTGGWGDWTDGGVECVDLFSNKNIGIVAEEQDFAGDLSTIQMTGPDKGYVAVGKNTPDYSSFWTEVIGFNPKTHSVAGKVQNIANAFGGLAFDGAYLYVGDRSSTNPGIVVVDPTDDSKKAGPFDMGLPPNALAFLKSN
jgi:hypothetical protein